MVGVVLIVGFVLRTLDQASRALGTSGFVALLIGIGAMIVAFFIVKQRADRASADRAANARALAEAEKQRLFGEYVQGLAQRFGEDNAQRILSKTLWQGATSDMIREMLGDPEDVSTRVFKTKIVETWKYDRVKSTKRFAKHVTLENGVCVGWKLGE